MGSILTGYYYDLLESLYLKFRLKLFKIDRRIHEKFYLKIRFYRCINAKERNIFHLRCERFIAQHIWLGREGLVLTEEMKFMVAASYVMITFRLPFILLDNFERILLFPNEYRLAPQGDKYKGLTDPKGTISLSWRDHVAGYEDPYDSRNLGLHEFAHAIMIDKQHMYNDVVFENNFDLFVMFYRNKILMEEAKAVGYFRDYAFENAFEFFSISIESFFETPEEFHQKMPELYLILKKLFRTDMKAVFNQEGRYGLSVK